MTRLPPGWIVLERAMVERRWAIEVWNNPNVPGFTARMLDSHRAMLVPQGHVWWGHGPTVVDALQALAAGAAGDPEP